MKRQILLLCVLVAYLFGCSQGPRELYVYQQPQDLADGLSVGSMVEMGMDEGAIANAVDRIRMGRFKEVHSMLIYKSGKLVVEEYFPGHDFRYDAPGHRGTWTQWNPELVHDIHSVTKSITSACIGIALDKGFIEAVDQSIFDYLPDHQAYRSEGREDITIEHLLTMTSGLPWYEWGSSYNNTENPVVAVWYSDKDPVSFTFHAHMKHEPGTHYSYYGGSQVVLSEILKNATGKDIDQFSREYLFEPLGIDTVDWYLQFPNGVYEAAGSLRMTPRSMLKVGVTYLNDGQWQGQQVISSDWVRKSATNYRDFEIDVPGTDGRNLGYGYSWWIASFYTKGKRINAFEAGGWGGQKIFVIPELEAVVVFTGSTYTSKTKLFTLMKRYVVPALME